MFLRQGICRPVMVGDGREPPHQSSAGRGQPAPEHGPCIEPWGVGAKGSSTDGAFDLFAPVPGILELRLPAGWDLFIASASPAVLELERAGNEGKVTECLRGVAQLPAALDVPFLTEQSDVVA